MKSLTRIAILALALTAPPMLLAQDENGGASEIVVTGSMTRPVVPAKMTQLPYLDQRPLVGLKHPADGAVRHIEIQSDSRDADLRKREVEAMLLAALDLARKEGLTLVTGQFEIKQVTRENWKDLFPALASAADLDDEDADDDNEDEDESGKIPPGFEDDGSTTVVRLMVRTTLTGSIDDAHARISAFAKKVPATGRSVIEQKGKLALTLINPEQYRDEIYRRIADAAKHASTFYGPEYSVTVTGLDREIAWQQVSNTELFLYIPYSFTVAK